MAIGTDLSLLQAGRLSQHSTLPASTGIIGDIQFDSIAFSEDRIRQKLLDIKNSCYVVEVNNNIGVTTGDFGWQLEGELRDCGKLLLSLPAFPSKYLGDRSFQRCYGTSISYMAGAMAGGIASEELVISLGKNRILGSFGTGGLSLDRVEQAIRHIQEELPDGPYAFNLLHSPNEPQLEKSAVDLYLQYGVRVVEASAFLDLTGSIVRYRAAGLSISKTNQIEIANKVIAKVSRQEVAEKFLRPAPTKLLKELVSQGLIDEQQAILAEQVPMADDITVEADSGGHTDNRPLVCLLPSMVEVRDEIQDYYRYAHPVRIGAAGGIGTPQSALGAFMMGAAYVVTGSVNQSCKEADTSLHAKQLLAQAEMSDVMMAPAGDMFEMGVKLQVLKRGTLFPMRAQQLSDLYRMYSSIEEIPVKVKEKLERQVFKQTLDSVWTSTVEYLSKRNPKKLERANSNPKLKMALVFRWYLGLSSRWSSTGLEGRERDYQIWCGPSMGAFNDWVRGSYLEVPENRGVVDVASHILNGAAYLYRLQTLKNQGLSMPASYFKYVPSLED